MKNNIFLLIFILTSGVTWAAKTPTGYLFPAFALHLDPSVWSFDQEHPSFLQVSGYFDSQKQSFTHVPSGIKIQMTVHVTLEPFSLAALDSTLEKPDNKSTRRLYKNLYSTYNSEYMQTSNYMIFEQGYYLSLDCNKSITTAENEPIIKSFVDAFEYVGSKELDRIAGYPFTSQTNEDSLKMQRKAIFKQRHTNKKEVYYIDHLLLLDKTYGFSFERWEKEMAKDNTAYSVADYALADAQIRIPPNIEWLSHFMPYHNFQIDDNSEKSLRRYISAIKPDADYRVERITERGQKLGVAYLIYCEDTVRFLNVHINEKDEVSSYDYYLYGDVTESRDPTQMAPLMMGNEPNPRVWSFLPISYMSDIYLVTKTNEHLEGQQVVRRFSTNSLHTIKYAWKEPLIFGAPSNQVDYDLLVEYTNSERILNTINALSSPEKGSYNGQPLSPPRLLMKDNSNKTKSKKEQKVLLKSPLLISDYDGDKILEYTICYVTDGQIVFADSYELTAKGIEKISLDKIKSYLYSRFEVYSMTVASYQILVASGGDGIEEYYSDHYYDDGYPVEMEVVGEPEYYMEEAIPSPVVETMKIYDAYDCSTPAAYVGGEKAMQQFLNENLKRPEGTLSSVLTVYVNCNILSNGAVQVENAMNDNGKIDAFTTEAKRIVASMPLWTPAKKDGRNVSMKKMIPVIFSK